jgi:hypothetical protein
LAPGKHSPLHVPFVQTNMHAGPSFLYLPVGSQSWGCLPMQVRMPGGHIPEHIPFMQTFGQAGPVFVQCPIASQTWGWLPAAHCRDVGMQSAQTPLPMHTPAHAFASFFH